MPETKEFKSSVTPEHLECLIMKKDFIERVSYAVSGRCGSIMNVAYEAFENETGAIEEILKVTYLGGAIAIRCQNMNSHSAMLRDLGRLADGGYYEEVKFYKEELMNPTSGWHKII